MSDVANRDDALKCAELAKAALAAGDAARAERFASKAARLYRCRETEALVEAVAAVARGGGGGSDSGATASASGRQNSGSSAGFGDEGLRQRRPGGGGGGGGAAAADADASVTPEQRQLVSQILRAKDFYEILGVPRGADDDAIKRAYRKLALKLHPDKNRAPRAEDAFKAVSRAFGCLSDADSRAYYDRTGHESGAAAAAAAQAAAARGRGGGGGGARYYAGGGGPFGGGGGFYARDDIDPEEIFNMFFGAGAFGPRAFRAQYPPPPMRRAPPGAAAGGGGGGDPQRSAALGLLQLLPVILLVLMTLFSGTSEPAYSLARDARYPQQLATARLGVPFYVKSVSDFESRHGRPGTHARAVLERQVESEHYERAHMRCQQERMAQHRMATWGNRARAEAMATPGCDELRSLNERLSGGGAAGGHQRVGVAF